MVDTQDPLDNDSIYSAVQHRLAGLRYYTSPVDGHVGRVSSQAIANYQQDQS